MAWVPIVLGIQPARYFKPCEHIEVIYRSGDKVMRLDGIYIKKAERTLHKYGLEWTARSWRYEDGLSDWEAI